MLRHLLFFLIPLGLLACTPSSNAPIEVTGVVTQQTFPGAPNYGNIAQGDQAESFWFITTDREICFAPDSKFVSSEIKLSTLQLLNTAPFNLAKDHRYVITGKTFPAISGHHHSPVMIAVESVHGIDNADANQLRNCSEILHEIDALEKEKLRRRSTKIATLIFAGSYVYDISTEVIDMKIRALKLELSQCK